MRASTSVTLLGLCAVLGCGSTFAAGQASDNPENAYPKAAPAVSSADNSAVNTRDKDGTSLTPQDQGNAKIDRTTLAGVRRAVVRNKDLSVSAHNVKIMVDHGVVTLRGPVSSQDERSKIAQLAMQVAGVTNVDNQLEVSSK